ncbi:hypothetical protein B0T24DRAFT_98728 [Lasiosphaeria ovina]|uniref:Abc transporter protein n=1 Tax=Lasiosphaeria ovina TaxID=92902 RepID=A0AAE0JVH7_9PEZI|nr:hypothetical protein B0T24DRAFT_98728 [Lasiosphaeria ovina]
MGRPSLNDRPDGDALSLHTQPGDRLLDDDAPELQVDDFPPLYEDVAESSTSSAPLLANPSGPPSMVNALNMGNEWKRDDQGNEYYIDERLNTDPKFLEKHVEWWAQTPPRPYVRILGTHKQNVDNAGKKEKKTVTDFDVQVELTPYLYSDATNRVSWRELRTIENSEVARRGTVLRKRAPGSSQNIEVGLAEKPTLAEWTHRYCASSAGLKCLALERRVVGFDAEKVKQKLNSMVRATNYRGCVQITFPTKDARVEVYNDCKTNRWRMTTWVWWLCTLTLMILFTWPYLFFRTKRFEVVVAEWPFSKPGENGRKKYVSISEDQWYNMWGRAISRAVLEKRQCTLDQQDLIASQGADPVYGDGIVDEAMGFLRAGINAMNEVNRHLGWGHDS